LKKFLQTQGVVKPSMYVAFIANVWCAFSNWLFMYALGWGFLGAPLARASCQWVMVFCILAYMAWTGVCPFLLPIFILHSIWMAMSLLNAF
jgi:MATE family multidrug resistance protein